MEEKSNRITGISIGKISAILFLMAAFMTCVVIFVLVKLYDSHKTMIDYTMLFSQCDSAIDDLSDASAYLSAESRLYVDTGNISYLSLYDEEVHTVQRREVAMDLLQNLDVHAEREEYYTTAMKYSTELEDLEKHAMALASMAYGQLDDELVSQDVKAYELSEDEKNFSDDEALEKAKDLLYSKEYIQMQETINYNIKMFRTSILHALADRQAEAATHFRQCMMNLVVTVIIFFMFVYFLFLVMRESLLKPLRIFMECIEKEIKLPPRGCQEMQKLAETVNNSKHKK